MIGSRAVLMFVLSLGLAGALSSPVMAQEGGGGGGGGGRGGRFDPAAMRERRLQNLKEALGVSDEEWTALEPKISKIQDAQMALLRAGIGGGRQRGGAPVADNLPQSPVATASIELRQTLDNKESTPEQIKAKLQALREAKEKANAEVAAAQAELKELLTARQEAVLVSQGLLN